MGRVSDHLGAIAVWAKGLQLAGQPLVTDCRLQLDLVDAEDVERQTFRSPCAFLVLGEARLLERPDGGRDGELKLAIAVAAKAMPGQSADAVVIDRAIALSAALAEAEFGAGTSRIAGIRFRPVLQAALETKGLAVAAVEFSQLVYALVPAEPAVLALQGAYGAGAPRPGGPQSYLHDDGEPTPAEQAIIDGWTAP